MPNISSAEKRMRQSRVRRLRNIAARTRVKTTRRKFFESVSTHDKTGASGVYKEYCSVLDKAAKSGVISKNTAVRRKRRAAALLAKQPSA